jgi:hypothetical protein
MASVLRKMAGLANPYAPQRTIRPLAAPALIPIYPVAGRNAVMKPPAAWSGIARRAIPATGDRIHAMAMAAAKAFLLSAFRTKRPGQRLSRAVPRIAPLNCGKPPPDIRHIPANDRQRVAHVTRGSRWDGGEARAEHCGVASPAVPFATVHIGADAEIGLGREVCGKAPGRKAAFNERG